MPRQQRTQAPGSFHRAGWTQRASRRLWTLPALPLFSGSALSESRRRRLHRRHVLFRRFEPIPALTADQQVLFQALDFRRWQGPHGVAFEIVFGSVLHDFNGSLLVAMASLNREERTRPVIVRRRPSDSG